MGESVNDEVRSQPIGVFDSGMGGLTVLAELRKRLPSEDFIYLGDTARVPYGSRSARTVQRYSLEVAEYLLKHRIKILVIACNTATAHAEQLLKETLPIPVIGVIEPGVYALLSRSRKKKVGVIGTRSTVKSDQYGKLIRNLDPEVKIFNKACPLFVPLVEEGWIDKQVTSQVIQEYLSEMVREKIDTLILGCTHYPLLKGAIQREFPEIELVDSSVEISRSVEKMLEDFQLMTTKQKEGQTRILLTDVTDQMERLEKLFYGFSFQKVEEVVLSGDDAH